MVHDDLASVPMFALPQPYSFEGYRAGREDDWLRIHERADQFNAFTPFVFADQFRKHWDLLPELQFYVLNAQREPIGTATAWVDERTAYSGRVHWIATLPEYQNLGLGKALLSQVCSTLLEKGHRQGSLSTSTARVSAISLYLKFGFVPLIQSESDEISWSIFKRDSGIHVLL